MQVPQQLDGKGKSEKQMNDDWGYTPSLGNLHMWWGLLKVCCWDDPCVSHGQTHGHLQTTQDTQRQAYVYCTCVKYRYMIFYAYNCMYIYIYTYNYIHTYVTYMHMFDTYICQIHTYITYIHMLHTYIHTYLLTYFHTYILAYLHTYILTYILTYLHILYLQREITNMMNRLST